MLRLNANMYIPELSPSRHTCDLVNGLRAQLNFFNRVFVLEFEWLEYAGNSSPSRARIVPLHRLLKKEDYVGIEAGDSVFHHVCWVELGIQFDLL